MDADVRKEIDSLRAQLADVAATARRVSDPSSDQAATVQASSTYIAPYWEVLGLDDSDSPSGDWEEYFEANSTYRDRWAFVGGGTDFGGDGGDGADVAVLARVRFINDGPAYDVNYFVFGDGWGGGATFKVKLNGTEDSITANMSSPSTMRIAPGPNTLVLMKDEAVDHVAFYCELFRSDSRVRWVNPNG